MYKIINRDYNTFDRLMQEYKELTIMRIISYLEKEMSEDLSWIWNFMRDKRWECMKFSQAVSRKLARVEVGSK